MTALRTSFLVHVSLQSWLQFLKLKYVKLFCEKIIDLLYSLWYVCTCNKLLRPTVQITLDACECNRDTFRWALAAFTAWCTLLTLQLQRKFTLNLYYAWTYPLHSRYSAYYCSIKCVHACANHTCNMCPHVDDDTGHRCWCDRSYMLQTFIMV